MLNHVILLILYTILDNPALSTTTSVNDEQICVRNTLLGESSSLREFSMKKVFDALVSVDLKKATGADLWKTRLLLLAGLIIVYP